MILLWIDHRPLFLTIPAGVTSNQPESIDSEVEELRGAFMIRD
jgi:hypothetical protein